MTRIVKAFTFEPEMYEKLEQITFDLKKKGFTSTNPGIALMAILELASSRLDERFIEIVKTKLSDRKERYVYNAKKRKNSTRVENVLVGEH